LPAAPNLGGASSPFRPIAGVTYDKRRVGPSGETIMTRLIIDAVLFSCMFAFATGIVIAAAHLLI